MENQFREWEWMKMVEPVYRIACLEKEDGSESGSILGTKRYPAGVAGDMEIISDSLNGVINYKGINPDTATGMRIARLAKLRFLESPEMMRNVLEFYKHNKELFEGYANFGPAYVKAMADMTSKNRFESRDTDTMSDMSAKKTTFYL